MLDITKLTHPNYLSDMTLWQKWRNVMGPANLFKNKYLVKYSQREDNTDFQNRLEISPVPAYAKSNLIEIRNSLYTCLTDIARIGGPKSYQDAIHGLNGGVDRVGSTMNYFVGYTLLQELLSMRRVGVYIDRPETPIKTRADEKYSTPYLYYYPVERIKSWSYNPDGTLHAILLEDDTDGMDDDFHLVTNLVKHYRYLVQTDSGIRVVKYDSNGAELDNITLNLCQIPFVMLEISESLLDTVADYQIALLNMESSDINYALKANFPFYTEQHQPTAQSFANRDLASDTAETDTTGRDDNVSVGVTKGRRYGKGLERPQFIHPSPEPLRASMEKQGEMKQTIRHLMQLTIASLKPIRESAESKDRDQSGLQSGLSYIGLELQHAESKIAEIWADYYRTDAAYIKYPDIYDTRTPEDRLAEAERLSKLPNIQSTTYKRELATRIARALFEHSVPAQVMTSIIAEIEAAPAIVFDSSQINEDIESGILDRVTAAALRLYPKGTAEKASKEHVQRLSEVAIAQSAAPTNGTARGVDPTVDKEVIKQDRTDPTAPTGKKPLRGEGKK